MWIFVGMQLSSRKTPKVYKQLTCNILSPDQIFPCKFSRLLSRVVIIPFKGPSIQAKTQEQKLCFTNLKHLKEQASNSIGYFISLAAKYRQTGCFEVDEYESRLGAMLPKCGGRTVKGYANLLWFTEQVSNRAYNLHV